MLSMEIRKHDLIVTLAGDLDHNAAEGMRDNLDERISDSRIKRLIFDMHGVDFMDSSGIGMLLGRYRIMSRKGGSVAVIGVGKRVDRIFEMAGLYRLIEKLA